MKPEESCFKTPYPPPLWSVVPGSEISSHFLCCSQGEYGLHEAVQEIKMKKEEIAVRDRYVQKIPSP